MITSTELKKLEREAHAHGTLPEHLMENAATEAAKIIENKFDLRHHKIVIFCGTGNNGGDGLCLARHLKKFQPLIIFAGDKDHLSEEAHLNYDLIKKDTPIISIKTEHDITKITFQKHLHYIFIDALIGTGLIGNMREPLKSIIEKFNKEKATKISIDIPSGIDPDTGHKTNPYVNTDLIITYHDIKPGIIEQQEKTVIIDIGLPQKAHNTKL